MHVSLELSMCIWEKPDNTFLRRSMADLLFDMFVFFSSFVRLKLTTDLLFCVNPTQSFVDKYQNSPAYFDGKIG